MSYNTVLRTMNKADILSAAMIRLSQTDSIDPKYDILMSGIEEDYELNSEKRDVLRVLVHDTETNEDMTLIYDLARDLNICPKTMYNYYLYRFSPRNLRLGDAIRVVKEKVDENDKDHFAYNAVIITANVRQITFVMVPSKGPMTRYLTARECYEHGISIYKYKSPDDYDTHDSMRDEHTGEIL